MKSLKLVCMAMVSMTVILVSCSGEDGEQGQQGFPGVDGSNGTDGISCWDINGNGIGDAEEDINDDGNFDALDCQGSEGQAGQDGNANVQEFKFGLELQAPYTQLVRDLNDIVDEPSDYAFLFYMEHKLNLTYSIPGHLFANSHYARVHTDSNTGHVVINFYDLNDQSFQVPAGEYKNLIVVAIELSNTGKTSENIMAELKAAGVDTSDYHAVAAYFGLE
ncbi:hypothetical protein [Allomuricauda sp.]|uniref:hypothetical protein n=1 Tax=Flagellimonas alginolytica TaxID=3177515 RepID=UPI0025FFC744|nr:hypothetical protein [Allomuricauda sp.]